MKEIVLQETSGLPTKSYGGNSLTDNIQSVSEAISKVQYTERIWNKSRSQFTLKMLTCSQYDPWMRLRQVSAEMARKRSAYTEAKLKYAEKCVLIKIKRNKLSSLNDPLAVELGEIKINKIEFQASEMLVKIEGAMKEMELLATMHDDLVSIIGEVTEEKFEENQIKAHLKRAVAQSIREVRECGTIRCGNQEYLEQVGVCVTSARVDIEEYLQKEADSKIMNTSLLHAFIDAFADRYAGVARQQSQYLGFSEEVNKQLTYTPAKEI